ncbi:hypothetical protein I2I11_20190 [Pontibacter sp. 172403-2]|uniref:hypothetical protein n=1 Tax=Pontibacter rufus TaxID=2791028 RepID=UPI0018AFD30F|nr:hypothetical protein [Pontibacter sp. 172403-2]MBF9255628.1 hypothetical protein [Pontibacter sp. 172403-2]
MAVFIYPKGLTIAQLFLNIEEKIKSESSPTWEVQENRIIHTASSGQWNEGGYLTRAELNNINYLAYYFKTLSGSQPRSGTYGVYNGRFVEFLMNQFANHIEKIEVKDLRKK